MSSVMVDGEASLSPVDNNSNDDDHDDDNDDNDSEGAVAEACDLDDQDFAFAAVEAAAFPSALPQFVPLSSVFGESHNKNSSGLSPLGGHARIATTQLDGHIRTKRPRLDDRTTVTGNAAAAAAAASPIHPPDDEAISAEAEAATEADVSTNNKNNMSSSCASSSSSSVGAVDGGSSSLTVTSSSSSSHPSSKSSTSSSSHSSNSSIAGSHHGGSDGLARWQWRSKHPYKNRTSKNKSKNPKSSLRQQPSSGSFSSALTTEEDDLDGVAEEVEGVSVGGGKASFKENRQQEQPLHNYDAPSPCCDSQPLEQEKPQAMAFQSEEEHAISAGVAATLPKPIFGDNNNAATGRTMTTMLELQMTPQNSMTQFLCHYDHPPTPKASNVATLRNNHFNFGETWQQDAPPFTITATTMANTTTMINWSDTKNHRKQNSHHRRRHHHHHHGNNHHNNSCMDATAVDQLTSRLNNWCSINIKTKRHNNIYAEADLQQNNDAQDTNDSNQEQQQQQLPPPPLMASYPAAYRSNLYNPSQDYDYSNHRLSRHIRKLQCQSANKEVMRALRKGAKKPPGMTTMGDTSSSNNSSGVASSSGGSAVMDARTTALKPPSFLWIMKDPNITYNDSTVGACTAGPAIDPPMLAVDTTNITSINNGSNTDIIMGE